MPKLLLEVQNYESAFRTQTKAAIFVQFCKKKKSVILLNLTAKRINRTRKKKALATESYLKICVFYSFFIRVRSIIFI